MNNKAKLIVRRAYGFHSARAALALVHLTCGPVTLTLPHEQRVRVTSPTIMPGEPNYGGHRRSVGLDLVVRRGQFERLCALG